MAIEEKKIYRIKKNTGPHSMIIDGKRKNFQPGDSLEAYPHQIEGWLHKMERVEKTSVDNGKTEETVISGEELEKVIEVEEAVADVVSLKAIHKGGGRYNVINIDTGEQINDEYLNKKEADSLVESGGVNETGSEEETNVDSTEDMEESNSVSNRRRTKRKGD